MKDRKIKSSTSLISILVMICAFLPNQVEGQQVSDSTRLVSINKIYLLGNDKTKPYIILREMNLKEGDQVMKSELAEKVEWSQNNVYNTNLFSTVKVETLELDSSSIDLLVKVEERWYVWPSFVLRPIDNNFIDWWTNRGKDFSRIRFGPKLDIYNVRGRREKLRLVGLFGFDQTVAFQYSFPFIDKQQKHGLSVGVGTSTKKNMFYQTVDHVAIDLSDTTELAEQVNRRGKSAYMIYTYRPSFYDYHYVTFQGYQINISDDILALNPNFLGDGRQEQGALGIAYTFIQDKRDNRNYPLSGTYTFASVEKLGLGAFKDVDIWRLKADFRWFQELKESNYLKLSLGFSLTSPDVAYMNNNLMGEEQYVIRGFEQFIIEGPINVLSKNEYRRHLFTTHANLGRFMPLKKFKKIPFKFYAKSFVDAGYVKNYDNYPLNTLLTDELLWSTGIGLDLVLLYDVTLRFEYSYNSEGNFLFNPNLFIQF
ncbi:MAG: BamA/TamA family outer membrane protein [Cyclobacteriaceae bacterium]